MISRRVFLKNGSFALVSLGFAPSFLARTAFAAGPARRSKRLIAIFQRGAVDGLSVIVPYGENDYYRVRPTIAIARPTTQDDAALDLDGFFGFNPRLAPLKPLWDRRDPRHRARVRVAGLDAVALRRAGLHGNGDAGREGHGRRMAESLPAGAARRAESSFRAVALYAAAAAHVAGSGAGAGDESRSRSSGIRAANMNDLVRGPVSGGRGSRAEWNGTRSVRRDEDAARRRSGPIRRGKRRATTRAVRSGRR